MGCSMYPTGLAGLARWKIASASKLRGCVTSCCKKVKRGLLRNESMFCSEPVSRLSTHSTLCPFSNKRAQRLEPINPAPPVTTVFNELDLQSIKETGDILSGYDSHVMARETSQRDRIIYLSCYCFPIPTSGSNSTSSPKPSSCQVPQNCHTLMPDDWQASW